MEIERVERVDHHGIVAGVIKDLGLIERIDFLLGRHPDEKITTGEAVAGMIINGLGFTDRPMTLTPQFFENCPLNLLFREGIEANDFNRFKLGRSLDEIYEFGCSTLFADLANKSCEKEGIDRRFGHLDSTTFSLTGQYFEDSDENAIKITHGYSKDHRPDLKQVVLELLVSQEGGVPLIAKAWDGNTSDNEIFNSRSKALVEALKNSEDPVYLIADSKLYSANNAESLKKLPFITRIPETISSVSEKIKESWKNTTEWLGHKGEKKYQEFTLDHYNISQRWIVVYSEAARNRIQITIAKKVEKEKEKIQKELFHLRAERFECLEDAKRELSKKSKKWEYHELDQLNIEEIKKYIGKGRPKVGVSADKVVYQVNAGFRKKEEAINNFIEEGSCYVLGTNIGKNNLSAKEIIDHYSEQQVVERGFRFLKDPLFFTSSLFIKKQSRIEAMLMVMTLALLVYSIAERRLRHILKKNNATLPNQINKQVQNPTLRWVFQLLDGVCRIKTSVNGVVSYIWTGLTELRPKLLKLLGNSVKDIYQIS